MKKTIVVCGHGPGISDAVARHFGREGYAVALVARNAERLQGAAAALTSAGIEAKAFACDLADEKAVRATIREARSALGPIAVLHYNAYSVGAGDLVTAKLDELNHVLAVSVGGLVAAVQEAYADLKEQKGSVLVTGGGFAFYDPQIEKMTVQWQAMGIAISKAAQHKATGLLHQRLAGDGVYVGEVVVLGTVKGTAFDRGQGPTLDPAAIAAKFWELHQGRSVATVSFTGQ